jgi:hypothetical protein
VSKQVQPYVQNVEEARIIETAEMNLVTIFGAKSTIDGDQYCWLVGDNLQDGGAGFGKSPYLAALDFNKNFYRELSFKSAQGGRND